MPAAATPPVPPPLRGEREVDLSTIGHTYPAGVTAHFASREAAEAVLKQVRDAKLHLENGLQMFVKEAASDEDPGLQPGEAAVIIQVADEKAGQEVVRLCERGNAKHALFYESRRIGRG